VNIFLPFKDFFGGLFLPQNQNKYQEIGLFGKLKRPNHKAKN